MLAASLTSATSRAAFAQLGALVSPGQLSRAHASLEGIANCLSCHSAGEGVSAAKCLTCHKPIADRVAQKKGVHRNATTDCVACHVEHAGVDGELRPFNQRSFNHAAEAGFALDGLHAPIASTCSACHKTRSFLTATASCVSCHADAHKGTLGPRCETCHTTSVKFADSRTKFDHGRTAFPLTGAHTSATCVSCHANSKTYKGVQFASCANCHTDPHRQPFAGTCSSCHVTQAWRTTKVDHARTAFPLRGRHAAVECGRCHTQPALKVKPPAKTCAACHADPHKGSFKQDCSSCHNESGWPKGAFDHSTTQFPLVDKHAGLACVDCHKAAVPGPATAAARGAALPPAGRVSGAARGAPRRGGAPPVPVTLRATDFRGLATSCASCHRDVHLGELGTGCESCHTARTFEIDRFRHSKPRPFFDGQHAALRCAACHPPAAVAARASTSPLKPPRMAHVGLARTSEVCASCHRDVHVGQVGPACESCHTVESAKFAVTAFAHERTKFPLRGKHAPVACVTCHKVETGSFPAGVATARRLTGLGTECASCHQDPHGAQLDRGCQRCHSSDTFKISRYTHIRTSALRSFFDGKHTEAPCSACHKAPAGSVETPGRIAYRIAATCTTCHTDVHRGALGPRCESCHRP